MSYVELHTGTLTKVNIRGLTVEEYCKHLCEKYGYELTYNGDKKQWYLDAYKKFDNVCYNLG